MKTAVITGGTKGIGLALCEAFFNAGYVVWACYSKDEKAAKKAKKLLPYVNFVKCDVSDEKQVESFFSSLNRIDVLVNNAGISLIAQIQDTSLADWNKLFSVNVTGTFLCSREAAKYMISETRGCIINISSVWGEVGASCEVAYSASKAAVIGFTKALAKEVGYSSVRVNCITPGVIDTSMNDHLSEEEKEELEEEIPALRFGTGEDIAKAALFLSENEYINGAILPVNGGFNI